MWLSTRCKFFFRLSRWISPKIHFCMQGLGHRVVDSWTSRICDWVRRANALLSYLFGRRSRPLYSLYSSVDNRFSVFVHFGRNFPLTGTKSYSAIAKNSVRTRAARCCCGLICDASIYMINHMILQFSYRSMVNALAYDPLYAFLR